MASSGDNLGLLLSCNLKDMKRIGNTTQTSSEHAARQVDGEETGKFAGLVMLGSLLPTRGRHYGNSDHRVCQHVEIVAKH